MDAPKWHDVFSADELAAALDVHSLRLAKRYGDYSLAADVAHAAECIRDISEQLDTLDAAGAAVSGNRFTDLSWVSAGRE